MKQRRTVSRGSREVIHQLGAGIWQMLPRGSTLPEASWQRRHHGILMVLVCSALLLPLIGFLLSWKPRHSLLAGMAVALCMLLSSRLALGRRPRALLASLGLLLAAASSIHLSGGYIELHFLFFITLGVITLYQDWLLFCLAIGLIVLHHGFLGMLSPHSIYNHPDAWAHPWKWAAIHGGLLLLSGLVGLINWRLNEQAEERLRHEATHDGLTGLPNRVLFLDQLRQTLLPEGRRSREQLAVLFLDLDRMKPINDSLGHAAGDELLKTIGCRLQSTLRAGDLVARIGGDEFAIMMRDATDVRKAIQLAERLQQVICQPVQLGEQQASTSASIGIALSSAVHDAPEKLLRDADSAMYQAKTGGKACYVIFDPVVHGPQQTHQQDALVLQQALANSDLRLYYQPLVALRDERITGFEALLRWQHPEHGLQLPGAILELAERSGQLPALGDWVLRETCAQLQRWQGYHPELSISVNLASKELAQEGLGARIKELLEQHGLTGAQLCVEFSEETLLANLQVAEKLQGQLRRLGVQIALDDFGTGYASLSQLQRFRLDLLKIDRTLISRLEEPEMLELVHAIIELAHILDLQVIAEGIETRAQSEQLRRLGCDYGQGYFFSPPLPAEQAQELLALMQLEGASAPIRAQPGAHSSVRR